MHKNFVQKTNAFWIIKNIGSVIFIEKDLTKIVGEFYHYFKVA